MGNPEGSKHTDSGLSQRFFLQIIFYSSIAIVLYFFLPLYCAKQSGMSVLAGLGMFYAGCIGVLFFCLKKHMGARYELIYKIQAAQEELNLLNDQNNKALTHQSGLLMNVERYKDLEHIVEALYGSLILDEASQTLVDIVFSAVAHRQGVCILYLIDKQLNLQMVKAVKEDKGLLIKAKEGDAFDFWVLRHASPLFIEDARNDFRFDAAAQHVGDNRPIRSLISAPLVSEHRFLGTIRLDHQDQKHFSQDDLRLLAKICDLGATALENCELFERLENLAVHDGLTSLYTKGYFLQRFNEECAMSLRQKEEFCIVMCDIDYFKCYNDKYGHSAGDLVLKVISAIATEFLKSSQALLCRFGGEEFAILIPHIDKKKAFFFAQGLREKVACQKIILRREETGVTISMGVAAFPEDASVADELLRKADKALYEAKNKGRNQVCGV